MIRRVLAATLVSVLALASSSPAYAQGTPAPEARKPQGDKPAPQQEPQDHAERGEPLEVRIVGSKADALQRVPGSSQMVTAKEVARTRPASTGELARRVPGLTVRTEDATGLRLNIGIRGFDSTRSARTLILEDGVPIALNPYGEPDLYFSTPVERIRAIEVVKGSGSILFGPQSVAGAVNFLTIAPPTRESWWVDGQYGTQAFRRIMVGYGNAVGDSRYVVQATHKAGDGFRGMDFAATDAIAKVIFPTSSRGEAMLKLAAYDETSNTTYVGLTLPMYRQNARQDTVAPYDRFDVRRYDAMLTHDLLMGDRTKWRAIVFGHTTSRIAQRQDFDRAPVDGVTYERVVGDTSVANGALYFRNQNTIRDRTYEVVGLENILEHGFATGPVDHKMIAGVRVMAEGALRRQTTGNLKDSVSGAVTTDERASTLALAAYLQDRIAFRDDLLVTPGVRVEHAAYSRRFVRDRVNGTPTDVDVEGTSSTTAVLPGIGMVMGTPRLNVFGGVHAGFAPPRIASSITSTGRDVRLEPERSLNHEIGARAAFGRLFRVETAGFMVNFMNQIIQATPAFGVSTELVNGGRTRHMGVESSGTVMLGRPLRMPGELDVSVRHTWVRAEFVGGANDGNRVPYAPSHLLTALLDIDLRMGLGGQFAWHHVTSQYTDDKNTEEPDASGRVGLMPAYDVVDLGVRYRYKPARATFSLLVKNALDDIYVSSRRPDGIFTAGFRQVMAGLRFDNL